MSIEARLRKLLFWATLLIIVAAGTGLWLAYSYVTDSDTLSALIRGEAPRYFTDARLVIGRARVRPLVGDLNLIQVNLWQKIDGLDHLAVRIPWLDVRADTSALANGELHPREVVAAQPELRICRRKDGTWNLQGLLADPWPCDLLHTTPQILIQNGTVQLIDGEAPAATILRDVSLTIRPSAEGVLEFEGTAKSNLFESVTLKGTYDRATGSVVLSQGEMSRLAVSDTLREKLPPEIRPVLDRIGLSSGEIDVSLNRLSFSSETTPSLRYDASLRVRSGMVSCSKLPFPLTDFSALVHLNEGNLTIERAEGYNGKTTVRVRQGGTIDLTDPLGGPLQMTVDVLDLEFDNRLRAWTPPQFAELWKEYRPQGWVSLAISMLRAETGGPVRFGIGVDCRDVAMVYDEFPYPVEHLRGLLKWEGDQISIDCQTLSIGGKPASARGTITNPGPNAVVELDFQAESLPIDKRLLDAMPPDVRKVVEQFQPTGSVRGTVHLKRTPPGPDDPPIGRVALDAVLDLNERCAMRWNGLPYPVTNLTGRLELHPDNWVFSNMRGWNGLASITGKGSVHRIGKDAYKTDLHLKGEHLPFDDQLRMALPQAWQTTWKTLRPTGSSTVDADIHVEPGKERYHLVIVPDSETRVELRLPRVPGPGVAPGETFDMPPMERVRGVFMFDNGDVTMSGVQFQFRGSPAKFATGTVTVKDNGQFLLHVKDLEVNDFRLDAPLRKIMPPVMSQFALRLDDGRTFRFRTDLGIGWSGLPGQPAWCTWEKALVVFTGNTIQTGLPLEHLQGQVEKLRGIYNGQDLEVHGALNFDSISLLGQQITQLHSPLDIEHNKASLSDIQGRLLGGELTGKVEADLDVTPRYSTALALRNADLQLYTKTVTGRQTMRGLISGQISLSGLGNDIRTVQGDGEAHISSGDLGQLPFVLRLASVLKLSPMSKTAFDRADATFDIRNGETNFDRIKLTGNAFSLQGSGTLSAQNDLDLSLRVLYGRDEGMRLLFVNDAMREFSGQIFTIKVLGNPAYPTLRPDYLPQAANAVRSLRGRRTGREIRE